MLIGKGSFQDCTYMYSSLMAKRAFSNKGALIQRRHICNLANIPGNLGKLLKLKWIKASIAHLQLQVCNDRDQVGISTALSIAIYCSLNHLGTCFNGNQGVGHSQSTIIVCMDTERDIGKGFPDHFHYLS